MAEVLERPLTARRAQTQERLMSAAVRVFAERGVIGASVEEICEAAGFTRGAFYSNFADKDELVLALIRHTGQTQVAAAQRAVATTKAAGPLDATTLVTRTLATFVETGLRGRDTVLSERELLLYAARQPALRGPYVAFMDECERQLGALIADALGYAGLEFTVPFADGLALLVGTWEHQRTESLFRPEDDQALMHTLLMTITRPVAPG